VEPIDEAARRALHTYEAAADTFDAPANGFWALTGRRTVERLGLESAGVVDGDWSGKSGYDAVHSLSDEQMPTAVVAANDIVASGAIRALIERGLDVPGDVSVTGWDNNEACQYLPPGLTSVELNLEGLGRNAMLSLVKAISGRELEPAPRPLQHVVWRESTGPAPRR